MHGHLAEHHLVRARTQANYVESVTDYNLRFWVVTVLTGVGAGVGAIAMMAVLRGVQHLAFDYSHGEYSAAAAASSDLRRLIVLTLGGIVAGVGWYVMRRRLGGTGGEPTRSVWTGRDNMSLPRTALAGAIQEVFIGLGGSLGREAAPQHIGAAFGSRLSRLLSLPDEQRLLLIACGAGAGVGSVYNVPLAGALFACELYLGSIRLTTVVPAVVTATVATLVGWITLPTHSVYHVSVPGVPSASLVVWALIAGPLIGVAAAGFVKLIGWASDTRPADRRLLILPPLAFAILGVISFRYPLLLGNGRDLAEYTFTATGAIGTLFALAALKPLVTAMCLRSGPSGGLFTPTLSTGAVLGAALGRAWTLLWPAGSAHAFALAGAAAMLAAGMQAPIAGLAFSVELTNHINATFIASLLTVAGAVVVARGLDPRSIYSARLPKPEDAAARTTAAIALAGHGPAGAGVVAAGKAQGAVAADGPLGNGADQGRLGPEPAGSPGPGATGPESRR
jgi:CIC family chloride channel protein